MWDNTEVQKKVENIITGVSGALNTPVAFATKTLTDNIGSISIPVPSFNHLPIAEEMQKSLSGVAERFGAEIPTTVAGATNLLNSVGTQFSQLTAGAQSVMTTVSGTIASATSVISSIADTGKQVLSGVISSGQQLLSGVVSTGQQLVSSAMGAGQQMISGLVGTGQQMLSNVVGSGQQMLSGLIGNGPNMLSGAIAQATGLVSNITNIIPTSITGALSGTINAAVSALNVPSVITGLVSNMQSITNLPSLVSNAISTLPANLLNTAANVVTGKIAGTLSNLNIIGDTIKTFISDFPDLNSISLPNIVTSMLSYNTDSFGNILEYAKYTDEDGNNLLNTINNNTAFSGKNVTNLSNSLLELCKGQKLSGSYPYGYNKNKYDGLLGIFSALGLADGLKGLLNCDSLFDTRSQKVLTNYGRPVTINNGDPYTYNAIIDAVGGDLVTSNPTQDLYRLNSNMKLDPQNDNIHNKIDSFNTALTKLGTSVMDIISGTSGGSKYTPTDTVKVLNMSKSNTDIMSGNIEDAIIKTAIGSLYTFQGI